MDSEHAVEIALKFVECINHQNLATLSTLLTEDHRFIDLAGDEESGKELMTRGWQGYFDLCPNYLIHISEVYVRDAQVTLIGRTTGSHTGQPRQEEIRETLLWVARVKGDQVSSWELYFNNEDQRKKLGLDETTRWTFT